VGDIFARVLQGGQMVEDALERFQAMSEPRPPSKRVKKARS
jgi:hypothetical protein